MCPVFQLNGGVAAGGDSAGEGVNLVALVAGINLGHVVDNLLGELALFIGVCNAYMVSSEEVEVDGHEYVVVLTVVKRNVKCDLPSIIGNR